MKTILEGSGRLAANLFSAYAEYGFGGAGDHLFLVPLLRPIARPSPVGAGGAVPTLQGVFSFTLACGLAIRDVARRSPLWDSHNRIPAMPEALPLIGGMAIGLLQIGWWVPCR